MAHEKRIAVKVVLKSIWGILNMPVSDIAGQTLGQVAFMAAKKGAVEWLQIEGNYERLAPWASDMIEGFVTSAEEARAAAAVPVVVP